MAQKQKILIVAKTYPTPSERYEETVCTGGIAEDGRFIRLYPIDYRYRPFDQWYKKYQWIEVEIVKHKDPRPESFRPIGEIRTIGEPLSTKSNWTERRRIVLSRDIPTMCSLEKKTQKEVSFSLIKPKEIIDITYEETEREWGKKYIEALKQQHLFGMDRKPLEKIPYNFRIKFRCHETECNTHTKTIFDWEVGELYRRMRDKFRDEITACDKVTDKLRILTNLKKLDVYFFVGTILKHGQWTIVGTFSPHRTTEDLF